MNGALALLAVLAFTVGCETQADRDKLKNAQLEFQTAQQVVLNDLTARAQAAEVEYVNNTQGEHAGFALAECFSHGFDFPRRVNVDGQARPMENLSNRNIANCDRIMKIMQKQQAAQEANEKRKDAAYDKAHPQK
jgi:hypothetical protein